MANFLSVLLGAEVLHEPFNARRQYGHVVKSARNQAALLDALRGSDAIAHHMKHCFEMVPKFVNPVLLSVTEEARYVHLRLRRVDEVARLESLAVAQITGAYAPRSEAYDRVLAGNVPALDIDAFVARAARCRAASTEMDRALLSFNPIDIAFEDFYYGGDLSASASSLVKALQERGIEVRGELNVGMLHAKQGTEQVSSRAPNIAEFRAAIRSALTVDISTVE